MSKVFSRNKYAAVRHIECGHSTAETAELVGVSQKTINRWWNELHPGLPIPNPAPRASFLRLIGHTVRKVEFDIYECPYCGGMIHWPQLSAPKPWHCPWCGKDVK